MLNGWSFSLVSSVPFKLYLMSTGRTGCLLCIRKNGENFVEECLLTLCANKTPSITYGHSDGLAFKAFTRDSLIFRFWRSQRPFDLMVGRCNALINPSHFMKIFYDFVNKFFFLVVYLNSHASMPADDFLQKF